MTYRVEVNTSKDVDEALFEIYRDLKRRKHVTKKEIPSTQMERVDCECDTDTRYVIKR